MTSELLHSLQQLCRYLVVISILALVPHLPTQLHLINEKVVTKQFQDKREEKPLLNR